MLQSGCGELTWEKCADLPSPLYGASVAVNDDKVYVMADGAPQNDTYNHVYVYDVRSNWWDTLPPPKQYMGRLQIINDKVTIIGGRDRATKKRTNRVTTFSNDKWIHYYPNMLKARFKPGVTIHQKYVIVAGGVLNDETFSDSIEVLNWRQCSQWVMARMKLPKPMWAPALTITDDVLYIVGYNSMHGSSRKVYQIPVQMVTLLEAYLPSSQMLWIELPPGPHASTAIIPNSSPPAIIGGSTQGVPTGDIRVLDIPNNSWKKIASLTTPRVATAVASFSHDSILVIGGYTGGNHGNEVMANSITLVEKGTVHVRLYHIQ